MRRDHLWTLKLPGSKRFPRLQILTIEEIFTGKKINLPTWWSQDTFKKSPGVAKPTRKRIKIIC